MLTKIFFTWIINSSANLTAIKHVLMSYPEERKFITYLTNINLRALLMSDRIINDLRGATEQHSQKMSSPISHSMSIQFMRCFLPHGYLERRLDRYTGDKGLHPYLAYRILIYPCRVLLSRKAAAVIDLTAGCVYVDQVLHQGEPLSHQTE